MPQDIHTADHVHGMPKQLLTFLYEWYNAVGTSLALYHGQRYLDRSQGDRDSAYLSGKYTSKAVEASLILRWDQLGNVKHEGAVGVAISDSGCVDVIQRSFVQVVDSVLLCLGWRRQMPDHHLQQGLSYTRKSAPIQFW